MKEPINPIQFMRNTYLMSENINDWYRKLEVVDMKSVVASKKAASRVAVFSADMINGFCREGNLASERIDTISQSVANLFRRMHRAGVRDFALVQEWHSEDAKEFASFPPHGIMETEEAEAITELSKLPFAHRFVIFRKNALTPAFARRQAVMGKSALHYFDEKFEEYLKALDMTTAIVVGNCTDLCVRELAMYLRMWANQYQKDLRVIVPENCVETFDMPFRDAYPLGVRPHPGDVYHLWALYEMARNGIDIVKEIS